MVRRGETLARHSCGQHRTPAPLFSPAVAGVTVCNDEWVGILLPLAQGPSLKLLFSRCDRLQYLITGLSDIPTAVSGKLQIERQTTSNCEVIAANWPRLVGGSEFETVLHFAFSTSDVRNMNFKFVKSPQLVFLFYERPLNFREKYSSVTPSQGLVWFLMWS